MFEKRRAGNRELEMNGLEPKLIAKDRKSKETSSCDSFLYLPAVEENEIAICAFRRFYLRRNNNFLGI
jgi:hypothetical protein